MISMEARCKVKALLEAIKSRGLGELVAGNHAWNTLNGIVDTGSSMPDGSPELDEVTEQCAMVLSSPMTWGCMEDRSRQQEWRDFCTEWGYNGKQGESK